MNTMTLKPLTEYGWNIAEGVLSFEWDSDKNIQLVKEHVDNLLKGCGCKMGCQTRPCQRKKIGKACTEGCTCTNTVLTSRSDSDMEVASIEEILAETPLKDIDEMMDWVFWA